VTYLWTDTWGDRTGCWADVYDVGFDVYRTCEATPDPASHLGLCAKHEAQLRVWSPPNVGTAVVA
jgi:hypothetical protein